VKQHEYINPKDIDTLKERGVDWGDYLESENDK
jgi:hypothetical protein